MTESNASPDRHDRLAALELRPLPGSDRPPAPEVQASEPLAAERDIEVTLILRRQSPLSEESLTAVLTPEELASRHGASTADLELVTRTLEELGARVVETDPASRRVRVAGSVGLLSRIFGTSLENVTSRGPDGKPVTHRHRTGGLSVPAALDGVVTAVLGLDDRPQARSQLRIMPMSAARLSYTPPELGRIYNFPAGTDGSGQSIAIIELGGGYSQQDLDTYFSGLGIATPSVTSVGVDGGTNKPGQDPNGADGEVLLDIEVAGALAPKAGIVVYFAPNTDAGFLDALSQAAQASPPPAAVSISWGQSEDAWTQQARTAFDQALADAAALGVTVTAAAGDTGSTDGAGDGKDHVDFPASSPHALACGGTRLTADPATGTITAETVWNDGPASATGGGFSDTFPVPSWQSAVLPHRNGKAKKPKASGRGVPDVSGVADPQTGYKVFVDGKEMVIGGTSAVAPLWAALIARLAQASSRRFGLLQPLLYGNASGKTGGFRDITAGNNGTFTASAGWDPCTGLGSPDGDALLARLNAAAPK